MTLAIVQSPMRRSVVILCLLWLMLFAASAISIRPDETVLPQETDRTIPTFCNPHGGLLSQQPCSGRTPSVSPRHEQEARSSTQCPPVLPKRRLGRLPCDLPDGHETAGIPFPKTPRPGLEPVSDLKRPLLGANRNCWAITGRRALGLDRNEAFGCQGHLAPTIPYWWVR